MLGFSACVPTDLPGKRDRPLRPPGWSVHTWGRRQMTHCVSRQSYSAAELTSSDNKWRERERDENDSGPDRPEMHQKSRKRAEKQPGWAPPGNQWQLVVKAK